VPDVIVIGAGFAGLSAATALAEAGARVDVFEARPGLGGRATTFRDPVTGERIDNGQHVIAGCYDETLRFLRRIGTAHLLHRPATLRVPIIDENGVRSELTLPPLPAPFHLLAGVLAWNALTVRDRLSIVHVARSFKKAARERGWRSDDAGGTVRQWLNHHRQSPRLQRLLWEPLALAALNQSIDEASAASFLAVAGRMFGPAPDAATLLFPAVPLDELYAKPARDFLVQSGSRVVTNAPAQIVAEGGRVVGVRVRDQVISAATVIAAVPWFALADLFQTPCGLLAGVLANERRRASSPIVTVNIWLDPPGLGESFVGLPGRTFQWAFDRRLLAGPSQSHVSLVSSGSRVVCDRSNDELTTTAIDELRAAVPRAQRANVRHASVVRERRATFSLRFGNPPRPSTRAPIGGLFLAGDWIDTGLPATIESAVVSGHAAARAVG